MNEEALTAEEAAERMKVPAWTVRQLCKQGSLPAAKIGRAWRIASSTVDRALRGELGPLKVKR